MGFPGGSAGKESSCSTGDLGSIPGFHLWVGKIPWRREKLHTLVFWPGEFHGLHGTWGRKELDMTEQLSLQFTSRSKYRGIRQLSIFMSTL